MKSQAGRSGRGNSGKRTLSTSEVSKGAVYSKTTAKARNQAKAAKVQGTRGKASEGPKKSMPRAKKGANLMDYRPKKKK